MRPFILIAVSILLLSLALTLPVYSASLTLGLGTDKQTYNVTDMLKLTGSVNNGSAVPDALVFFEVVTPKGNPWIVRTLTTGQTPSPPFGKWPVQVFNVSLVDSGGTPQSSFSAGQLVGFSVTISNNEDVTHSVIITLNGFYSNGVPFEYMVIVNGTLNPNQSVTYRSYGAFYIPVNAVNGMAAAYFSVFNSSLPSNSGLPYSPETAVVFNITSGVPGSTPPLPSGPLGTFNVTFPLMYIPIWLGNYTVYAITHYGMLIASNQTVFNVTLRGDLNHDGKVDMRDIAIVARAFNTVPGDPRWNPIADLSGPIVGVPDGRVDMRDISYVAKEFGIVAIP